MQPVVSRRFLRTSFVAISLLALSACSMFSSSDTRYEPVELTQYDAEVAAAVRWSAPIGSGSGYGFAPAVVGEGVFAATPNAVAKVDLASGRALWRATPDVASPAGEGADATTTGVGAGDVSVLA